MSSWLRLWTDMPTDPKFRLIARKSGQPVAVVLAVYVHMLTTAAAAEQRGEIEGWDDEVVAIALDMDADDVAAVREAMQGRLLDGDQLTGWEKRQPQREDGSAERAKAWRERKKAEKTDGCEQRADSERNRTQPNAEERPEQIRSDTEEEQLTSFVVGAQTRSQATHGDATAVQASEKPVRASRLPGDWRLPRDWGQWAVSNLGMSDDSVRDQAERFRDYWRSLPAKKATKTDWEATWRNWCRRACDNATKRSQSQRTPSRHDLSAVNYGQGGAL